MTRTTSNQVQRSQASSTPFTVLGLEPLSLHLPAPKIFQVKSLLRKGKLPLTKHHPSNPKRRAFSTSDEVEATCLVLKGLFPWQQESQGSRTVLPTVHTEPSSSFAQKCEFRSTCFAILALEGRTSRLHTATAGKYNFPLSSIGLTTDKTMMGESIMWLEIRPSWNKLTVFPPFLIPLLEILMHSSRGEHWTATYIKSCPKLHEGECGRRIYTSISSGNLSDRILRAGKRLFKTEHSVFSRIRINASQRIMGEVKKEAFSNQAWR